MLFAVMADDDAMVSKSESRENKILFYFEIRKCIRETCMIKWLKYLLKINWIGSSFLGLQQY